MLKSFTGQRILNTPQNHHACVAYVCFKLGVQPCMRGLCLFQTWGATMHAWFMSVSNLGCNHACVAYVCFKLGVQPCMRGLCLFQTWSATMHAWLMSVSNLGCSHACVAMSVSNLGCSCCFSDLDVGACIS